MCRHTLSSGTEDGCVFRDSNHKYIYLYTMIYTVHITYTQTHTFMQHTHSKHASYLCDSDSDRSVSRAPDVVQRRWSSRSGLSDAAYAVHDLWFPSRQFNFTYRQPEAAYKSRRKVVEGFRGGELRCC